VEAREMTGDEADALGALRGYPPRRGKRKSRRLWSAGETSPVFIPSSSLSGKVGGFTQNNKWFTILMAFNLPRDSQKRKWRILRVKGLKYQQGYEGD
jgi:hypothetical protein